MRTSGCSSLARASASPSTSRPSASVLSTSTRLPPYMVSTSVGRLARADGMFSAMASQPVTLIGSFRRAAASTAPSTAAAPAMSTFMYSMPVDGFSDRPPESNVMPLPTNAAVRVASGGVQDRRTSRGGLTEPWPTPMIPPNPCVGELLLVQHGGLDAAGGGLGDGAVGEPGRGQQVGRAGCRARGPAPPTRARIDARDPAASRLLRRRAPRCPRPAPCPAAAASPRTRPAPRPRRRRATSAPVGQRQGHAAPAGERPDGRPGGLAQHLVGGAAAVDLADADRRDHGRLDRTERGEPGDLTLVAAGAEVGQHRRQPAGKRGVDLLAAGLRDGSVRAFGDGDDEDIDLGGGRVTRSKR